MSTSIVLVVYYRLRVMGTLPVFPWEIASFAYPPRSFGMTSSNPCEELKSTSILKSRTKMPGGVGTRKSGAKKASTVMAKAQTAFLIVKILRLKQKGFVCPIGRRS